MQPQNAPENPYRAPESAPTAPPTKPWLWGVLSLSNVFPFLFVFLVIGFFKRMHFYYGDGIILTNLLGYYFLYLRWGIDYSGNLGPTSANSLTEAIIVFLIHASFSAVFVAFFNTVGWLLKKMFGAFNTKPTAQN